MKDGGEEMVVREETKNRWVVEVKEGEEVYVVTVNRNGRWGEWCVWVIRYVPAGYKNDMACKGVKTVNFIEGKKRDAIKWAINWIKEKGYLNVRW